MKNWKAYTDEIQSCLCRLVVTDMDQMSVDQDNAFKIFKEITTHARQERKTVFLIGNGASASMASHVAADLAKNARIRTELFSDLSMMTAIANDISYDDVFAEPLRLRMNAGDMLIAISSSGASKNVLNAVREANHRGGLVFTLSGMSKDNPLRKTGMLNFYLPAMTYGMIESCHAALLHYWIDKLVEKVEVVNTAEYKSVEYI